MLGVILAVPLFVPMAGLAFDWVTDVEPYLFTSAGEAMAAVPTELPAGVEAPRGGPLEPGIATLVVLGWTAVSLALATISLRRRDA